MAGSKLYCLSLGLISMFELFLREYNSLTDGLGVVEEATDELALDEEW